MEIKILYSDHKTRVKAVYLHGELFYTRTYIMDADGFVDTMITVFKSGSYDVQRAEA